MQGALDIHIIIECGLLNGGTHPRAGGEMADRFDRVFGECLFECGRIGDLDFQQSEFPRGECAAQIVPFDPGRVESIERINPDDFVAVRYEFIGEIRADESGGSCDANFHRGQGVTETYSRGKRRADSGNKKANCAAGLTAGGQFALGDAGNLC